MKRLDSSRDIVDLRGRANFSEGYAAILATIVIWSTPSLFQYYLNRYYDPWAQNFYRYLVAFLAITPLAFFRIQHRGPRIDWRAVMICFVPCLPNVVHQITQVMALFYMGPGVYAIFTRSSVIFTALLALAFFPEERHIIRQWQFQAGTLLGLIGTPLHAGSHANFILILSAVTCITLAHVLYYVAIREIGVALAQTLQLLCPAGALALSAWIYGERLAHAQLWSAAVLLLGAFLAMRVKPIATTEAAENI